MVEPDNWASAQDNEFANFTAADGFDLNEMTGFDGKLNIFNYILASNLTIMILFNKHFELQFSLTTALSFFYNT